MTVGSSVTPQPDECECGHERSRHWRYGAECDTCHYERRRCRSFRAAANATATATDTRGSARVRRDALIQAAAERARTASMHRGCDYESVTAQTVSAGDVPLLINEIRALDTLVDRLTDENQALTVDNATLRLALRSLVVAVELYCPVPVRHACPSYLVGPWDVARAVLASAALVTPKETQQ